MKTGIWTTYNVRIYVDEGSGPMSTGYTFVHWDDAKNPDIPCLDNGYCTHPEFKGANFIWDGQTIAKEKITGPVTDERKRLVEKVIESRKGLDDMWSYFRPEDQDEILEEIIKAAHK